MLYLLVLLHSYSSCLKVIRLAHEITSRSYQARYLEHGGSISASDFSN